MSDRSFPTFSCSVPGRFDLRQRSGQDHVGKINPERISVRREVSC